MAKTTISDIAACFRILLEREPTKEELLVHFNAHAGNDLADVLKNYLESDEFRNRNIVQVVKAQPNKPKVMGR